MTLVRLTPQILSLRGGSKRGIWPTEYATLQSQWLIREGMWIFIKIWYVDNIDTRREKGCSFSPPWVHGPEERALWEKSQFQNPEGQETETESSDTIWAPGCSHAWSPSPPLDFTCAGANLVPDVLHGFLWLADERVLTDIVENQIGQEGDAGCAEDRKLPRLHRQSGTVDSRLEPGQA